MQHTISSTLLVSLSECGFSLDELVIKLKAIFQTKGFPGILELILNCVDESLCLRLIRKDPALLEECFQPCCNAFRWELKEREDRTFRTITGQVEIRWRRLRCAHCGGTLVPLRQWLGIEKWERKTGRLEQLVIETVMEQSYRRSSEHLDAIGSVPVPKSTAHRWVVQTQGDECARPREMFQTLMLDGTGFKRRPEPEKGLSNRGEVRVAIGLTSLGQAVALGSWSGKTWEEIGLDLCSAAPPEGKLAELLVSDQEPGLAEALAGLINRAQPCHWHLVRDTGHKLWAEKASLAERHRIKGKLAGIIALEIPAGDVQVVGQEEKKQWQERIKQAEDQLSDLAKTLAERKYHQVADHLQQIKNRLFGYLKFWLETGLAAPRTNSFLERIMRELGRRIKKIGFGWSEKGAAKMCRLILKRITEAEEWERWWDEKMGLADNVAFHFRELKLHAP
jgi:hypothetical protein